MIQNFYKHAFLYKILIAILFATFTTVTSDGQSLPIRYIEVTGSSEMEVEPDIIILSISIEEYLSEDLNIQTQYRDYKKKASIKEIEQTLFVDLKKIGIGKDQIKTREMGNLWRFPQYGNDFLFSKTFDITLHDFNTVDNVIHAIHSKGVSNISIKELQNDHLEEYKKQVKTEALKAAKDKAIYLLKSIDKTIGPIISIIELSDDSIMNNKSLNNDTNINNGYQNTAASNVRNIKIRYQIKASFEIQ